MDNDDEDGGGDGGDDDGDEEPDVKSYLPGELETLNRLHSPDECSLNRSASSSMGLNSTAERHRHRHRDLDAGTLMHAGTRTSIDGPQCDVSWLDREDDEVMTLAAALGL
jgi:hypothetical protein